MAIIKMNCNRLVIMLHLHECNGRLNSSNSLIITFSHVVAIVVMDEQVISGSHCTQTVGWPANYGVVH